MVNLKQIAKQSFFAFSSSTDYYQLQTKRQICEFSGENTKKSTCLRSLLVAISAFSLFHTTWGILSSNNSRVSR